jgi:predicted DNA-binding protein YlxM (UPF0122 family)
MEVIMNDTESSLVEAHSNNTLGFGTKFPKTLLRNIDSVLKFGYKVPGKVSFRLNLAKVNAQEAEDFCLSSYFRLRENEKELLEASALSERNFVYNSIRRFASLLKRRERAHILYKNSLGTPVSSKSDDGGHDEEVLVPFPCDTLLDEKRELLDAAIATLTGEQKVLIQDYFYLGKTIKEISIKSNKSCQAIHRKVWQTVSILKKRINQDIQRDLHGMDKSQIVDVLFAA